MSAAMTSCSTAILYKLGTSLSKLLKFVDLMKVDFSFFDLNLNTIVQEKTPET